MNPIKKKILPKYNKAKRKLAYGGYYLKKKIFGSTPASDGAELDQKLVHSLSRSKIPNFKQLKHLKKVLSKRELWLLRFLILFVSINVLWLGVNFYQENLKRVPVSGGEYIEGVVGTPKYINPLYNSINDVDSDISKLIYSSLYTYNKEGKLVKDLVKESQVNKDNTEYTFKIREGVRWHNGDKLTANDIVFTFNTIKNSAYNSPIRSRFSGVDIEKVDKRTVRFHLSKSYVPFKNLLTFGILPEKLWMQIPASSANLAELNLKPVGSGPYKFQSLVKDKKGNIRTYNLTKNKKYYKNNPYIEEISFKFFVNHTEATNSLNENKIDGIGYLPLSTENDLASQNSLRIHGLLLPKINSIFFNQENNPALKDKSVREALAYGINREKIVNNILGGNAELVNSPLPKTSYAYNSQVTKYGHNISKAKQKLKEAGWEKMSVSEKDVKEIKDKKESLQNDQGQNEDNKQDIEEEQEDSESNNNTPSEEGGAEKEELTLQEKIKLQLGAGTWLRKPREEEGFQYLNIEVSAVDKSINRDIVKKIKEQWEKMGVKTTVRMVPMNEFNSKVVKTRDFEALFHSQVVDDEIDTYAYWHSSQTGSSGLNISNYQNEKVDEILKQVRSLTDKKERVNKYKEFQEIVAKDIPAIFLYSPELLYVQSKKIKGFDIQNIKSPEDRFSNISDWYIKTGEKIVW